jgi:hypothetical protein
MPFPKYLWLNEENMPQKIKKNLGVGFLGLLILI